MKRDLVKVAIAMLLTIGGFIIAVYYYNQKDKRLVAEREAEIEYRQQLKDQERAEYATEQLRRRGIELKGEYSAAELLDMLSGKYNMFHSTKQKMIEQGDGEMIEKLY